MLFGVEVTVPQVRKLVATVATLVARQLVARSENSDLHLTTLGRRALGEEQAPQHEGPPAEERKPSGRMAIRTPSPSSPRSHERMVRRISAPVAARSNLLAKEAKSAGRRRRSRS